MKEKYTDHDPVTGDPLPVLNRTTGERLTADGYGAIDSDDPVWAPRVNWAEQEAVNSSLEELEDARAAIDRIEEAVKQAHAVAVGLFAGKHSPYGPASSATLNIIAAYRKKYEKPTSRNWTDPAPWKHVETGARLATPHWKGAEDEYVLDVRSRQRYDEDQEKS